MGIENSDNESLLIERAVNGDKEAFEQLFRCYRGVVMSMLTRLAGNRYDAGDLLQETFIKAFLNISKYNNSYRFSQWLVTIARNTFIDHYRHRNVRDELDKIDSVTNGDFVEETPEELIIMDERRREMEHNIESLSRNYRKIIEMRYYQGLSYEEIAEELSIPVGTVKTRLFRAKERLNELINKKQQ